MHPRRFAHVLAIPSLAVALLGCPDSATDREPRSGPASSEVSPIERPPGDPTQTITRANLLAHEDQWPDIVALDRPWTPPDSEMPLKPGYRGAMIRVDEQGRVRIAFGRHGNHDIPIEFTDVVARANEIEGGARHKLGPNFVIHFGTQFVDSTAEVVRPLPTPRLAGADRFLCVFADPRDPGFGSAVKSLSTLSKAPGLQLIFFPLGLEQHAVELVRKQLQDLAWTVPFAYPQAAEVHARSLVGEVPGEMYGLLITAEGRELRRAPLTQPGSVDAFKAALEASRTEPAAVRVRGDLGGG